MIFLDFWSSVGGAIVDALRSLMLSLCEIIYKLIVFFFDLFMTLGSAEILENETVQTIYERVGLILGLFMIFRVVFSLIQYVTNPDMMLDKQKGLFNIVKKIIIVVVLLGSTPSIFRMAYKAQDLIIESNVIPKIIIGKNVDSGESGKTLAWYAFNSFYKLDENFKSSDECLYLTNGVIENYFKETHSLKYAYNCVNKKDTYEETLTKEDVNYYVIDFTGHGLVAVVVGIIILWMIIMYVIQIGVRVVQLAYLQLIAPAPIIMYLTPKGDDTLNKWVKQCTTTYIDFFIRVAVIYFVVFIINLLIGIDGQYFIDSLGDVSNAELDFITVIMILALLVFAQKLPKLLQEIFPSLGGGAAKFDFGIKSPKQAWNDYIKDPITGLPVVGKPIGWLGKKTASAVSAPIKRQLDIMRQNRKNRSEGRIESRDIDRKEALGRSLHATYNDKTIANAFESDYAESYTNLENAKNNVKSTASELKAAEEALAAAHNSGVGIADAQSRYDSAVGNHKSAEKLVKLAQERHDINRKRYTNSAKKEDAYNYYKNVKKLSGLGNNQQTVQQQNSQPQPGNTTTNTQNVQRQNVSAATQSVQQQNIQPQSTQSQSVQEQSTSLNNEGMAIKPEDTYVSESDIDDAYEKLWDLTGSGASQKEIDDQLNWINEISNENNKNLEDAYLKLQDMANSGASQEEIDAQIKKINDIKHDEIK